MLDKTSVLLSYVVLRWSSRCHPHDGVSQGPTEVVQQAMRAGGDQYSRGDKPCQVTTQTETETSDPTLLMRIPGSSDNRSTG